MNLSKGFSTSMGLALCILMSNCSRDESQQPQPTTQALNSNLRMNPSLVDETGPIISETNGPLGNNSFANGWGRFLTSAPDDLQKYAAGTSTLSHLWGSAFIPWVKPLTKPAQNAVNIVKIMAQKKNIGTSVSYSSVSTTIKNLKPGKKYSFTLLAASTIRSKNGKLTQYAEQVNIYLGGVASQSDSEVKIYLTGKEAIWEAKTFNFEATGTEVPVYINCSPNTQYFQSHDEYFHYVNLFVDKNSIHEIL